jgi:hypothetical protein
LLASVLEGALLEDHVEMGPYCHLRKCPPFWVCTGTSRSKFHLGLVQRWVFDSIPVGCACQYRRRYHHATDGQHKSTEIRRAHLSADARWWHS